MNDTDLVNLFITNGAYKAASISVSDIPFNRVFREACEKNTCGNYNRNWMCPPNVGDIDSLILEAKSFDTAIVFQTVNQIEDSFDIEGMFSAWENHNDVTQKNRHFIDMEHFQKVLYLGAGGCRLCKKCAKRTNEPCRHPDKALPSMEAYGISVYDLALKCEMKYINGKNTVTYFGAVLFIR